MTNPSALNPTHFAMNLKSALDFLEMSETELAAKTGLAPSAIAQIVSGQRQPDIKTVCAILNVIPIRFERLVR